MFSPDVIVVVTQGGADVRHDLRVAVPSVAIVAIVGGRDPEDRIPVLDAGADDCLGTPFRLEELNARIAAVWRRLALAGAIGRDEWPHGMAAAR